MLFVIGGSYQGKLDYVKERFSLNDNDIFECQESQDIDTSFKCIYHYERYVKYTINNCVSPITSFDSDKIVIMDDINCGVVPIDPEIRAWREAVGRAGSEISRNADEVVRVYCGLPKTLKTKTTKIYLIRHGRTDANLNSYYCGKSDLPLIEDGIKELEENKSKINYPSPVGCDCFTSSRVRCIDTFKILFEGQTATTLSAFDEMNFGDFELRKYDADLQKDPDFIIWTQGNNEENVCPNGESHTIMKRRVLSKFREIVANGQDAIIVTHGGPIAAIFKEYIPDSGLNYYEIQPKNCEGYCLEFENGILRNYSKISK